MENVRICILNSLDGPVGFMDNKTPNALHYWNDRLHTYLKGSASTFEFSCDVTHPDASKLVVGGRVAFMYNGRQYYFTIMSTDQTETDLTVTCYATALGLINTYVAELSEPGLQTIQWYVDKFDEFNFIEVGTNEIMSKQLNLQFNSDATLLSRLFEIADEFEAEIEFAPILNNDYSLKKIELNIYRKYDEETGGNGIGTRRTDKVIRYNRDIDGITKVTDISELFTAIKAYGNDDSINLFKMTERVAYDEEGNIKFRKPAQDYYIYAVQAKDQFPSSILAQGTERYISMRWSYSTSDTERLYEKALAELKKKSVPKLEYTITGYFDCEIGDIYRIQDEEFNPPLYVEARVSEIEVSFTDPSQNSVIIDNFKELKSQISADIMSRISEMTSAATEKAEQAIEIAGSVSEIAQGAKDIADEANTTAGNAQSTANQAQVSAGNAQNTADEALIRTNRMRFYEDKGLFISSEILDNVDNPENTQSVRIDGDGIKIYAEDPDHFESKKYEVAKFSGDEVRIGSDELDQYTVEEEYMPPYMVAGIPMHLILDPDSGLTLRYAPYEVVHEWDPDLEIVDAVKLGIVGQRLDRTVYGLITRGPMKIEGTDGVLIDGHDEIYLVASGENPRLVLGNDPSNILLLVDNESSEVPNITSLKEYVESHGGGTGSETDPIFKASPAHGITANDISKWNNKGDVKTVNGAAPDANGNVEVSGGGEIVNQEIVEVGIKDGWTYKKWANGLYECSINATATTAVSTTWGNAYRSSNLYGGEYYPIEFIERPDVTITAADNGGDITMIAIQSGGSKVYAPNFYFLRNATQTNASAHTYSIKATGFWKPLEPGSIGVPKVVSGRVVNLVANDIVYDNSTSGLAATEVQGAIDEIVSHFPVIDYGYSGSVNTTYNSTGTVTITFGKRFKETPRLSVMLHNSNSTAGRYIVYNIDSISATQAVVRWRNTATSSSGTAFSAAFDWIAVGR